MEVPECRARALLPLICLALVACQGLGGGDDGPPSPIAQQYLDQYNAIDTARKGKITMDEASTYYDRRFAELDTNRDGQLDGNEIAPMLPIMNLRTGPELAAALDRNGDGKVSLAEFQVIVNWLFQRASATNVLTAEEARRGTYRAPSGTKPREAPQDKLPPNR